ncbi:hypothetical protein FKG94_16445 [Exilibacterium tricleocarpae]|uniref:SLATT domain-containing protein n=1 Tax=Exilibacterium tricleocarpae TaxID=2591008 RepID=A0A545TAF7_9GAMM|nr:hypothetical protein [Exilibacterium tricleocarpae]TQV74196.1 hypothetical protein FKG94_16445 [Exilibacterium tricleocarpae]
MQSENETLPGFDAIVNYLAHCHRAVLDTLNLNYPGSQPSLAPGKRLGAVAEPDTAMLMELAAQTMALARTDMAGLVALVGGRLRYANRIRLAGGVVSAASSAGLLAVITQGLSHAALYMALLAFLGSVSVLVAQHYENSSAGGSSLNAIQMRLGNLQRELAELEGQYRLIEVTNDYSQLHDTVKRLNKVAAGLSEILVIYPAE